MGKRRRKLLRRKYQALPWNVYNKLHPKTTTDNSVMIQKAKEEAEVFLTEEEVDLFAEMLENQFGHLLNKPEPQVVEELVEIEKEIISLFENSVIEPEQAVAPMPNLKSLLKRELLALAKEKNLQDISSKNTKAQIIAAIQSAN